MAGGGSAALQQQLQRQLAGGGEPQDLNGLDDDQLQARCKEVYDAYKARYGDVSKLGDRFALLEGGALVGFDPARGGLDSARRKELADSIPAMETAMEAVRSADGKIGGEKDVGLHVVGGKVFISSPAFGDTIKAALSSNNQIEKDLGFLMVLLTLLARLVGINNTRHGEVVRAMEKAIDTLRKENPAQFNTDFPQGCKVKRSWWGPVTFVDNQNKEIQGPGVVKVLNKTKSILLAGGRFTRGCNKVVINGDDPLPAGAQVMARPVAGANPAPAAPAPGAAVVAANPVAAPGPLAADPGVGLGVLPPVPGVPRLAPGEGAAGLPAAFAAAQPHPVGGAAPMGPLGVPGAAAPDGGPRPPGGGGD